MTVQLAQDDFQRLVMLVADLDDFATETGRVRLAADVLEGAPRGAICCDCSIWAAIGAGQPSTWCGGWRISAA